MLFFLALVLIASIYELAIIVFELLINDGRFVLETHEIITIFGYFLLVLIGIEFFDSILTYLRDNVMHLEVIIMVAMIAIARKIILLDLDSDDSHIIGLAALVLALGIAYYLICRSNRERITDHNAGSEVKD